MKKIATILIASLVLASCSTLPDRDRADTKPVASISRHFDAESADWILDNEH